MALSRIPVVDLTEEIESLWPDLRSVIEDVARSGRFINGPNVRAFEEEVAAHLGVRYAVGVNSGTDALVIALRSLGVGPGDEVITTPWTFFATAEAVSLVGAKPVFVDIDPETYNLRSDLVERAVGPRTRAILPVHLYGHSADLDPIMAVARRHGLVVVEDVAQAFGGRYRGRPLGSIGHAAAFSFYPTKNLAAFGDGGLVATNDAAVAERARRLRAHGARRKHFSETVGYNSRLDELQAAVLRLKLRHVAARNEARRRAARVYAELLQGVPGVTPPFEAGYARHVYHQYVVRIAGGRRDRVRDRLSREGIDAVVHYPVPLHLLPPYRSLGYRLPEAERAAGEVLSLPMWPEIGADLQARVAESLRRALREKG
jgi:dTDP-4-amino-4,6-dideoxygalactose transaminase